MATRKGGGRVGEKSDRANDSQLKFHKLLTSGARAVGMTSQDLLSVIHRKIQSMGGCSLHFFFITDSSSSQMFRAIQLPPHYFRNFTAETIQ